MIDEEKFAVAEKIIRQLNDQGFRIEDRDFDRPWGGFCVIDGTQVQQFASIYFGDDALEDLIPAGISGKILFVAPRKRLSWQFHHRRNEFWCVIKGTVGVVTSEIDEENELRLLSEGDQIRIPAQTRHRLVGLDHWGVVAEIWEHTQPGHHSDENDVIRIQDDFDR